MRSLFAHRHIALLFTGIVALLVSIACGGEPAATATSVPAAPPTSTPVQATPTTAAPAATATKPPASPAAVAPRGTITIVFNNVGTPVGIPRACPPGCEAEKYQMGVYEPLLRVDMDGGLIPGIGEHWELSGSPIAEYVDVKIRKGVSFHKDFGPVTAADVAFTYNDANPTTTADSINDQAGELRTALKKVEVIDENTVRLVVNQWRADYLRNYFSTYDQTVGIHSKKVFDQYGVEGMKNVFVGTGPFTYVEWVKDNRAILEAVNNHWRKTPAVKTVRALAVPELAVRRGMLESGQADVAAVDLSDIPGLEQKGMRKIETAGIQFSVFFGGNYWEKERYDTKLALTSPGYDLSKPWIGDFENPSSLQYQNALKVRTGMALVLNRDEIIKNVYLGLAKPNHLIGIASDGKDFQEKWRIPYDVGQAKRLMQEAGHAKGFDAVLWPSGAASGAQYETALAIAGWWQEHLNIKVALDTTEYGAARPGWVDRTKNQILYRVCRPGLTAYTPDMPGWLDITAFGAGGTSCGVYDVKWSELYSKISKEPDLAKRRAIYAEFLDRSREIMTVVGVVEVPGYNVFNPKVIKGWQIPRQTCVGSCIWASLEDLSLQ